jgi:hypothetical protein
MQGALPLRARIDEPEFVDACDALEPQIPRLHSIIDGTVEFRLLREPAAGHHIGYYKGFEKGLDFDGEEFVFVSTVQMGAPALAFYFVDTGVNLHFVHVEIADDVSG